MNKDDLISSINEISLSGREISEYEEFLINVIRNRNRYGNGDLVYVSPQEAKKMFLEYKAKKL